MKDFVSNLLENNMQLKLPMEYAEYLQNGPAEIVFRDPANEAQEKLARKTKIKSAVWLVCCSILLWLLSIYVIAGKKELLVIVLMCLITLLFTGATLRLLCTKTQVAIGRAVIKTKHRRHGKRKSYSYYVAVAVDEPRKAIHGQISVSRSVYNKIEEGTPIMILNISSPGTGVVIDPAAI